MNEEEMKARIAELEGEKTALKSKNSELIDREKDAKAKADKASAERDEAAEKAEREAKDVEALEKRITAKFQKQIDALTTERDTLSSDLRTIRVDNEVKGAMAANKVRPELQPAVEALLLRQASYEDGVATINGKPIADAAKAFFASKDGSYFVSAPDSSGSGSTGTSGVAATKFSKAPETAEEYNAFMKYSATNKAEANAYATQWGKPELLS